MVTMDNQATAIQTLSDNGNRWVQSYWRPAMAGLYLALCFLDYGVRPITNYFQTKHFDLIQTVSIIKGLEPTVQIQVLQLQKDKEPWPPILNEFVHLAFGAILGVSAWSRGNEKVETIRAMSAMSSISQISTTTAGPINSTSSNESSIPQVTPAGSSNQTPDNPGP